MKTKITWLLVILSSWITAQENDVFERLHSTKLDNHLFITYDGTDFFYKESHINEEETYTKIEKEEAKKFQISNDHENTLKLFLQFYNPLKYTITSSVTEEESPDYAAIISFINNLPTDFTFASEAVETAAATTGNKKYQTRSRNKQVKKRYEEVNNSIDNMYRQSPILYDWISVFANSLEGSRFSEPTYSLQLKRIIDKINGLQTVENYLFQKFKINEIRKDKEERSVNEWIQYMTANIQEATDITSFMNVLKTSNTVQRILEEKKEAARKSLQELQELLSEESLSLESVLEKKQGKTKKEKFRELTASKQLLISAVYLDKMKEQEAAITKLKELNTEMNAFLVQFQKQPSNDIEGYKMIHSDKFGWKYTKMRTYEIMGTNLTGDTKGKKRVVKITVSKSQGRIAVFGSVGLFYTPFEYKNYGISEDKVAETQGDPVYLRPAAYLNFLYKFKHGDLLYPMFQVGITQGIKTPLFPIGAGFSIRNNFSITAGPLIAFQNELGDLSIGDTADDALLKDDITTHVKWSWYLSLNYKF